MRPPAFQFYADDFLAGTFTFTNEQRGLYIALLCLQWNQGAIGEETITALAGGMPPESITAVMAKFVRGEDDGMLRNPRLELERKKQAAFRAKCSEAGRRSVEGRLKVPSRSVEGGGQPEVNSPSPSPSPIKTNTGRFAPPSSEELKFYAAKIGLPDSEASAFFNYYESNGWKVGKNPMRKWESAMINWKKNWEEKRTKYSKPSIPAAQPRCGVGHNFV